MERVNFSKSIVMKKILDIKRTRFTKKLTLH